MAVGGSAGFGDNPRSCGEQSGSAGQSHGKITFLLLIHSHLCSLFSP